jgi:hypothetical protein
MTSAEAAHVATAETTHVTSAAHVATATSVSSAAATAGLCSSG